MPLDPNAPIDEPSPRYVPSGRVDLLRFIPLVAAGLMVAAAMAFLLLLAEPRFYIFIFAPLALGSPVFGMVWLATRWGRCRNPGVGGFVGLALAFAYYAGYWELSYLANVASRGPAAVALVEQVGGLPGLPGYVAFRCKTSRPMEVGRAAPNPNRPPGTVDVVFNGVFFAIEAILITGFAILVGRSTASRVYSERLRRWASSTTHMIPATAAGEAAEAILAGDWAALAAIPRVPGSAAARDPVATLTFETFPGGLDEPAHVMLRASGHDPAEFSRRPIPANQMDDLARAFPDLDLESEAGAEAAPAPSVPTALEESLDRLGLATPLVSVDGAPRRRAKDDFRARAVAASLAILGNRPIPRLATVDASLCLPASDDGARRLRRASWAFFAWTLFPLFGQFGMLGAGLALSAVVRGNGPETALSEALAAAGIIGFATFSILLIVLAARGMPAWRGYLTRRVGDRPGSPLGESDEPASVVLALENAATFSKPKMVGDDFAIVFFDHKHRRLVVEGLTHRHVVRVEDIVSLQPQPATSSSAVRVDHGVGEEPLALVFATMNPWKQVPLCGRLARRVEEEHFRRFMALLIEPALEP